MHDLCVTLTSTKMDEMAVYNHWKTSGESHKTLIDFVCKTSSSICKETHPAYRPIAEILDGKEEL